MKKGFIIPGDCFILVSMPLPHKSPVCPPWNTDPSGRSLSAAPRAGPDCSHLAAGGRKWGGGVSHNGSRADGTCPIFQLPHVSRCDAEMSPGYIKCPGFISFMSLTNTGAKCAPDWTLWGVGAGPNILHPQYHDSNLGRAARGPRPPAGSSQVTNCHQCDQNTDPGSSAWAAPCC